MRPLFAATGQGLLSAQFLRNMFFSYYNTHPNWERPCQTIRSKVLEYRKPLLVLVGASKEEQSSLEGVLLGIYKCYLLRLDYTVAFANLMNAAGRKETFTDWATFARKLSNSPLESLMIATAGLLENAVQLKTTLNLYQELYDRTRLGFADRWTEHQSRQLISTVEALGEFTELKHWSLAILPKLHKTFAGSWQDLSPSLVGASVRPIGTGEADQLLAEAMERLRGRYSAEAHTVLSTLLLHHRGGSYPHQARTSQTTDYDGWLVSGWNITKRKFRHLSIGGLSALPIEANWQRNAPGLALPDQDCGEMQMIGIPSVDAIHYTREPMNRDLFVQQTSSCGVLSLCFVEQ